MTSPGHRLRAAGHLARAFIDSKLTPLIILTSLLLGAFAILVLPREEEPQIIVPMIDIFVQMPGVSAREVEERVTKPMEKLLWEIPGVEYIYSTSSPGRALAVVRFYVGEDEEESIVKLNQKMFSNFDLIPPGASQPLIKPRSIDDVPILALTFWGENYDHYDLRRMVEQLDDSVKTVKDVSTTTILGGFKREVRVLVDPAKLASAGLELTQLAAILEGANRRSRAGSYSRNNREILVETGGFLQDSEDVGRLVVGVSADKPVYLRQVATIVDGPEEPNQYVFFGLGRATATDQDDQLRTHQTPWPAVTMAIAKRKGANAIRVADRVLEQVKRSRTRYLPSDVRMTVTRHYGETAEEKSDELLFHMIVDLPEGSTLEETSAATLELAAVISRVAEVTNYQLYIGTSSPYNFNGLVRHYYLRQSPHMADIQVNLLPKGDRSDQSHDVAKRVRLLLQEPASRYGARIKVAEVPPGPPVLETLVAEIYGPNRMGRRRIALQIREIFENTPGVVDVDWYGEEDQEEYRFAIDRAKAARHGINSRQISQNLRIALGGMEVGLLHRESEKEDVPIQLRLPVTARSGLKELLSLRLRSADGYMVPLAELVEPIMKSADKSIYHKNLMPVIYVTGDVAGSKESPVYAILTMGKAIERLEIPEGYRIEQLTASQPFSDDKFAMKWDGEWHITYEVFRDMGLAFGAVLVLIYVLVVGWFHSFSTPLVIMAAIPFSLIGILPAHGLMGAFFTATSMIGFIAGAGIVVRNSIILVDFVELRLREGMALDEAVIDAGAVRFRPMLLTASAVVVAATVILFDPIFQGLAISLMAGEVASLFISRMTVPILYFMRGRQEVK